MDVLKTRFGTLYKRGKVWYAYFKVSKGDYRRENTGFSDGIKAKEWIENRFRELSSLSVFENSRVKRTFADLAVRYFNDRHSDKKSLVYIKGLVEHFGNYQPTRIRNAEIERFKTHLENKKHFRKNQTISVKTQHHYLRWLKAILRYGAQIDWYSVYQIPYIKISAKGENQRFRILTEDELKELLFYSAKHINLAVMIGVYTGMRISEILNLKWSQIDFDNGFIYLSAKEVKEQYPRWIPLFEQLGVVLAKEKRESDNVISFCGSPIKSIKTGFNLACNKAKIKNLTFHDLRHLACRNFIKAGIPIETVKAILGHHSVTMTLRYLSLLENDYREAKQIFTNFSLAKNRAA